MRFLNHHLGSADLPHDVDPTGIGSEFVTAAIEEKEREAEEEEEEKEDAEADGEVAIHASGSSEEAPGEGAAGTGSGAGGVHLQRWPRVLGGHTP